MNNAPFQITELFGFSPTPEQSATVNTALMRHFDEAGYPRPTDVEALREKVVELILLPAADLQREVEEHPTATLLGMGTVLVRYGQADLEDGGADVVKTLLEDCDDGTFDRAADELERDILIAASKAGILKGKRQ